MSRVSNEEPQADSAALAEIWRDLDLAEKPNLLEALARAGINLVPGVGGAIDVVLQYVRASHVYRVRSTIIEIQEATGVPKFLARISSDPEIEALFVQAVESAMRTGYEAKRRVLGRVVAAAVLDDAKVDESSLFVMALERLDAPHLRALEGLARSLDELGWRSETSENDEDQISKTLKDHLGHVPTSVCAALRREGLVVMAYLMLGREPLELNHYRPTEFGRALLRELRDAE